MKNLKSLAAAVIAASALVYAGAAQAQTVVANWIQIGPGSSTAALAAGSYGDLPSSLTPTILARAVVSDGVCPMLALDGGAATPMKLRVSGSQLTSTPGTFIGTPASLNSAAGYPQYFVQNTTPGNFPDGTAMATTSWAECESVVPAGHSTATIGSNTLKLPIASPQKLLVFGDSGCRMSSGAQQNCHDPAGFPFAALANYEAQFKPDAIIHVGDYFYRDANCTISGVEFVPGCSNPTNANFETWGDTWDSWNADLFYPGKTLLATAPLVLARGNHESCGRGARGWFVFLDPHPFNMSQVLCAGNVGLTTVGSTPIYTGDFTPSYVTPLGQVNIIVQDSSFANDSKVDTNMAKNYDLDLSALLPQLPGNLYYVYMTHKPTYGLVSGAPMNGGDFTEQFTFSGNASPNSAFAGGKVPPQIALFLSGHIHQFEYVNFGNYTDFAPQLIVGVGGDNIDPTANPNGTSLTYAYQAQPFTVHTSSNTSSTTSTTAAAAYSQAEFGFALLQATTGGYTASVYNIYSSRAGRCTITLSPRNIACWD